MEIDLDRCFQGDRSAWESFVHRFSAVIYRAVAGTLTRHGSGFDTAECQDITQDVFLRLIKEDYRLLRSYDPSRSNLTTWLSLVARSTTLDRLRRRQLKLVPLDEQAHPVTDPPERGPAAVTVPPGLLSPRQRLVLHLLFDRDLDVAEVAQLLGIDAQTVRSTKHKALAALRRHFGVTG